MNMENRQPIQSFTQLIAWQESHKPALAIYGIVKSFPKEELFGLVSQMRRCSISISANIAEGFSRNTYKDKVQFYAIALGSVTELQNYLLMCRDIHYINDQSFQGLAKQSVNVHKLICGLIKRSKQRI